MVTFKLAHLVTFKLAHLVTFKLAHLVNFASESHMRANFYVGEPHHGDVDGFV